MGNVRCKRVQKCFGAAPLQHVLTALKQFAALLMGLMIIVGLGVKTTTGIPTNLIVWTCAETKLMYAPGCLSNDDCAYPFRVIDSTRAEWEQNLEGMVVSEAFKRGYTVAPACRSILQDPKEVSLLRDFLDYLGIWKLHPWNRNGTWPKVKH